MASHKARILALCKSIASEHPNWQFIAGKFVLKVSKEAHYIIDPGFTFKGDFVRFLVYTSVHLPKVVKLVNSVSHLKLKMKSVISEQPRIINLHTLSGGLSFEFAGSEITPDAIVVKEIQRWLTVGEEYLSNTWPVADYESLFELMKTTKRCYQGRYGLALCCLAAYLGKFDFIEQFYAGELPFRDANAKLTPSDDNLLAVLPQWQAQWQENGVIKV
jgi:hypothetical protein